MEGFDAAIAARPYVAAGADMIFPEALELADEFARFAEGRPGPLARQLDRVRPQPALPFEQSASLGYAAAIYPLTAFRAAMQAAERVLVTLLEKGTQAELVDRMQTVRGRCMNCSDTRTGSVAIRPTSPPGKQSLRVPINPRSTRRPFRDLSRDLPPATLRGLPSSSEAGMIGTGLGIPMFGIPRASGDSPAFDSLGGVGVSPLELEAMTRIIPYR